MYLPNTSATNSVRQKVNFKRIKVDLNSEFFFFPIRLPN